MEIRKRYVIPGLWSLLFILIDFSNASSDMVMDIAGWPTVFEINQGETFDLHRNGKTWKIELVDIAHQFQPDDRSNTNIDRKIYAEANVFLKINGKSKILRMRPYQMPQEMEGLRILIEITKGWAKHGTTETMPYMQKDIRLSAVAEEESWGPKDFRFPLQNYRWRSSAYNNTWGSLVPAKDTVLYTKGEDFGAVPDQFPIIACTNGTVLKSPLPNGDKASNSLVIKNDAGIQIQYGHMNIETIPKNLESNSVIKAGSELGKSGSTEEGQKSLETDPHLHVEIEYNNTKLNPFPYLVEAYLRDCQDKVLPIAGGYLFAEPGINIELNSCHTIVKPPNKIASYKWILHDGKTRTTQMVPVMFEKPGFYAEELQIKLKDGSEFRDITQVCVYDPEKTDQPGFSGWLNYFPVRNCKTGQQITFWKNDWLNKEMTIDFDDGTPGQKMEKQIQHAYAKPGIYTVTMKSADKTPVTIKCVVYVGIKGL